MERIILRHIKGSKASQVEEFPLAQFAELTLGRDPSSQVKFEPEKDDLVGRQHARIVRDANDASKFTLMDLNSRNGTFLNKSRVVGSMPIGPGDVIQLGAGGPEIEFDVDPRPAGQVKATRLAFGAAPAETGHATPITSAPSAAHAASGGVGKATVERMIGETKKEGRRNMLLVGAAVVVVAALGITWVRSADPEPNPTADSMLASAQNAADSARVVAEQAMNELSRRNQMTPTEIAARNTPSVVMIEMAWKLIDKQTGAQVYRRYIRNRYKGQDGKEYVYLDNGRQWIPTYVAIGNDAVEPQLTLDANQGVAIGGVGRGSGFVVTQDGFIITNRHVGAPWRSYYPDLDPQSDQGPLVDGNGNVMTDNQGMPIIVQPPFNWVPSDTKQAGPKGLQSRFEGRLDELQVAFPNNTLRIPAQIARISDQADVALIKIQSPQTLPKVEINDNYGTIAVGDPVVVMGYPGISGFKVERIGQKVYGVGDIQLREVPEPTLSVGNIGKIVRSTDPNREFSFDGDSYQLTLNAGSGNSGGPMFDGKGNVIGIYTWARLTQAQTITFATPIKYAMELMTVTGNR